MPARPTAAAARRPAGVPGSAPQAARGWPAGRARAWGGGRVDAARTVWGCPWSRAQRFRSRDLGSHHGSCFG
eukprot:5560165-Prymnesium_polylepis.1